MSATATSHRPESRPCEWRGAAGNRIVGEVFDADGPVAVVLVHGGGQTRHTWRRAARRLQARGLACLSFDQRGHGDSDWIDDGNYLLDSFRDDARMVLEAWKRPSVLIGTSLGGLVSMMVAGSGSPLVRGLVLVDTAPQLNPAEIDWLVDFLGAEAERGFASPGDAVAHLQRFFPDLAVSAGSIEKSLRRGADGRWHRHWDVRVVSGPLNSVALPHEQRLHDIAACIRVPVALVRAGASHLVSDAAVARLRDCVPQLEVHELPGAHHLFNSAESLQIIALLDDFLKRTTSCLRDRTMHTAAIKRTVGETLRRVAERFPDREAIIMHERRLTNADVLREAERHAAALARLGIGRDDHVGILMANCLEYLLLFYGCALLGARPVHLNSRYKREDLRYVIADSDIRILFTSAKQREHTDYAQMLRDIYPELAGWRFGEPLHIAAAPRLQQVFDLHTGGTTQWGHEAQLYPADLTPLPRLPAIDPEDIGLMMYTSGTTAHPKACLLSHRAIEGAGHALAERWRMTEQDRFWDPLPFFHMSTMLPLAACRASGACFIAQEHFDAGASVREIVHERATILFPSFPTVTNALFEHPTFDAKEMAAVRIVNNVGPPELLRRYAALLPAATHVSAYGLTEAGGVIAFHAPDDPPEMLAETSGKAFDGIEVRIVDPDTLQTLPTGARGEIWIRGPTNFSGYYKDAEKTAQTVMPDGFLRSGDLGSLEPSGHIRYLGRIKDMLKVGGENVAAIEIESWLCTHPAVKVAQIIGVADARLQEVAAAFIELREGATVTPQELIRYCKGKIASYKIPRYVQFVTEWPMSATKIQKFRLRDQVDPAARIEPNEVT